MASDDRLNEARRLLDSCRDDDDFDDLIALGHFGRETTTMHATHCEASDARCVMLSMGSFSQTEITLYLLRFHYSGRKTKSSTKVAEGRLGTYAGDAKKRVFKMTDAEKAAFVATIRRRLQKIV